MIVGYKADTDAYEIQMDAQRDDDNFYVVGSDPYWRVVSESSEAYLYKEARRTRPKYMMSLKTSHLQPHDELQYVERGGKMYGMDGELLNPHGYESTPNHISYVVTQNGDLRLGRGHTGLSGGHAVISAGVLKIVNGVATYAGNESGHYFPEGLAEVRGIKHMHRLFPWIIFPPTSIGKWMSEELADLKVEARKDMITLLTSTDKEQRRHIKAVWEEVIRTRKGFQHTPLM